MRISFFPIAVNNLHTCDLLNFLLNVRNLKSYQHELTNKQFVNVSLLYSELTKNKKIMDINANKLRKETAVIHSFISFNW